MHFRRRNRDFKKLSHPYKTGSSSYICQRIIVIFSNYLKNTVFDICYYFQVPVSITFWSMTKYSDERLFWFDSTKLILPKTYAKVNWKFIDMGSIYYNLNETCFEYYIHHISLPHSPFSCFFSKILFQVKAGCDRSLKC